MDFHKSLADPANSTFLMKMRSGFAHIGNTQFLPGYCLLFSDPPVGDLTDLEPRSRAEFLFDMGLLGDVPMDACQPLRINYGILGNSHPYLPALWLGTRGAPHA